MLGEKPSRSADPIIVGRSLPLSGPLKSYGEAKRDGADAYIRKVNAAGGIGGRAIELVTLDDNYQPQRTVDNLKQLAKERQPTAFLGLFGVPTIEVDDKLFWGFDALPMVADYLRDSVWFDGPAWEREGAPRRGITRGA